MKRRILCSILIVMVFLGGFTAPFMMNLSVAAGESDYANRSLESLLSSQSSASSRSEDLTSNAKNSLDASQNAAKEGASNVGQPLPSSADRANVNETTDWSFAGSSNGGKTRLVVGINVGNPRAYVQLERIVAEHKAIVVNTVSIGQVLRAVVVEIDLSRATKFVDEVRVVGLASFLEPSMKLETQFVPNDPYWSGQWGPQKVEADWAWNTTLGSHDILVAVVDTGIYYYHADLVSNYVALGRDWVNGDDDPLDDNGHGTHCAGTIAASINNGIGVAGLGQVRVMAEKVLDSGGNGYSDWIANGIIHAVDSGADIISMSLGGYGDSELIHEAVKYAYDNEVLVVAAAGNDNGNSKLYPAGYDEVVAVAATDQGDNKAWFSNWGDWIELSAPGVDIVSTLPWGYGYSSGTSMATPHVAGVAALFWSLYPERTRDWVRLWLRYTANDLGEPGFDFFFGYGRINARNVVEQIPPVHELIAYEWSTPPYVEPEGSELINASVLNFGANDETGVTVQLLANDTVVSSVVISSLLAGALAHASLEWNPAIDGIYNVTLYVVPVTGETSVENNALQKLISAGSPVKAFVLHSDGNFRAEAITNWQALNGEWFSFGESMIYIDYVTLNKDGITYEDLSRTEADVLIISCAYRMESGWQFSDSEIKAIEKYVKEGHGLIATAGTLYSDVPNNNKLAPLFGLNKTIMWDGTYTDLLHMANASHPLFKRVPDPLVFPSLGTSLPQDGRWDLNELAGGAYLAIGHFQESSIVVLKGLVYISPWLEVVPPYYRHHLQLLYNAIVWSQYQKPEHDLAVSLETPRHLRPEESVMLNATVQNLGLSNETNVELMLMVDEVVVALATIPRLDVDASETISYTWNPTVERTYNVTAYSPLLMGEELTVNNVETSKVSVRSTRFVLWDETKDDDGDSLTDNYRSLYDLLTGNGFVVDELTFGPITPAVLSGYDIFVLMDPELDLELSEIESIQEWVASGGALIIIPDGGYPSTLDALMLPYGVRMTGWVGEYGTTTNIVPHALTSGVSSIFYNAAREISVTYPSTALAWTSESYAFLATTETGEVVVLSDSNIMDNAGLAMADNTLLMLNIFSYAGLKAEHDIAVTLEAPKILEPGGSVTLNATIINRGQSDETDVEASLLINGTQVAFISVPSLLSREKGTIDYFWTPSVEGTYNITAYSPPLPNEELSVNNIASANVTVRYIIAKVAVLNSWDMPSYFNGGWSNDYGSLVDLLLANGFYAQPMTNEEITSGALSSFDVFVMVDNVPNDAAVSVVFDFWLDGGGIVAFDSSICFLCYAGILPPESQGSNGYYAYWAYGTGGEARVSVEHPVTAGYEVGQTLTGTGGDADYWVDALSPTSAYPYYEKLVEDLTRPNLAYVSAYEPPFNGKVVHIWDALHSGNLGLRQMIINAMEWARSSKYEHDVAVKLAAPERLLPGGSALLNATVQNRGLSNETGVELLLLVNGTLVDSLIVPELPAGGSFELGYLWTPSELAEYNVTAYAPPVAGENFTMNNLASRVVTVREVSIALISDDAQLQDVRYILDLMELSYDVYDNNRFSLYTQDLERLLSYRTVIFNNHNRIITEMEHSSLQAYLALGGNLIVTGYDSLGHPDDSLLADIVCSSSIGDNTGESDLFVVDATHPIMDGPYGSFPPGYSISGLFSDCDLAEADAARGAVTVAELMDGYDKIIATQTVLGGKVAYWNGQGSVDWTSNADCQTMFKNLMIWACASPPPRYEHDLDVSLAVPAMVKLGLWYRLDAIVYNRGLNNETNVELQLIINDYFVYSVTIDELLVGKSYSLMYYWTPTFEGRNNVTAYALPVLGEEYLENNAVTKFSICGTMTSLEVVPSENVFYTSNTSVGQTFEISIVARDIGDPSMYGWEFVLTWTPGLINCISETVNLDIWSYYLGPWVSDPIDNANGMYRQSMNGRNPAMPVTGTYWLVNLTFQIVLAPAEGATLSSGLTILPAAGYEHYCLLDSDANEIPHAYVQGSYEYIGDGPPPGLHDVAILDVTASTDQAYQGWIVKINVTAANHGSFSEVFVVILYCDETGIAEEVVSLDPNATLTISLSWNTTGSAPGHDYLISAAAVAVPGETNMGNNEFLDGAVRVKMLGDINGDGAINAKDAALMGPSFSEMPGNPNWNPQADMNQDGYVNAKDVVLLGRNFGIRYP